MAAGWLRSTLALDFLRHTGEAQQAIELEHHEVYGLDDPVPETLRRYGAPGNRQPIGANPRALAGWRRPTFFEDFYFRVYVIPTLLDFGAVASDAEQRFTVWNAWLSSTTIEGINGFDELSTRITGPAVGAAFKPLMAREYTAFVDEDGPISIGATYVFETSTDERPQLRLIGERARLLIFAPNWRDSYQVTVEFKTELLTTRAGREQRRALRRKARKTISYRTQALSRNLREFQRHMAKAHSQQIILPEETRFVSTVADVGGGNTVFRVDSVPSWLVAEQEVVVRAKGGTRNLVIQAVIGDQVVFKSPPGFDLPAGTPVMLALRGRLAQEISSDLYTNTVTEATIDFRVTPATGERTIEPVVPPDSLDWRPIFWLKPNWGSEPALRFIHPREEVDYEVGRVTTSVPIKFATRTYDYTFSGRSERDIAQITGLFEAMRGRAGEFYWPSWTHDLPFDYPLTAGTRTMEFDGPDVFDYFAGDTVHRAVFLMMPNGEPYRFNSLVPDSDDPNDPQAVRFSEGRTILTFRYDWPRTIQPHEPIMTGWLYATRFASDQLVVEWLTRTVGQVRTSFTTLEDLPYNDV